jgi:hypothetical protein
MCSQIRESVYIYIVVELLLFGQGNVLPNSTPPRGWSCPRVSYRPRYNYPPPSPERRSLRVSVVCALYVIILSETVLCYCVEGSAHKPGSKVTARKTNLLWLSTKRNISWHITRSRSLVTCWNLPWAQQPLTHADCSTTGSHSPWRHWAILSPIACGKIVDQWGVEIHSHAAWTSHKQTMNVPTDACKLYTRMYVSFMTKLMQYNLWFLLNSWSISRTNTQQHTIYTTINIKYYYWNWCKNKTVVSTFNDRCNNIK